MSESNPSVTFGVEIEFVVKDVSGVVQKSSIPRIIHHESSQEERDELREMEPWRQFASHIANTLRDNGISNGKFSGVRLWSSGPWFASCLLRSANKQSRINEGCSIYSLIWCQLPVTADEEKAKSYRDWYVKRDSSVKGPIGSRQHYGLELASPILNLGSSETQDIEKVCNIIKNNYEVSVNETCGLHVHVGKGREILPSYKEVKNLFAILWTFENRLRRLHPSQRHDHEQCRSMHVLSPLAQKNLSPKQSLQSILSCQSTAQVITLFTTAIVDGGMAYDGYNIIPDSGETIKRTLEFRQHEGTLDPESIINWATVCAKLLQYAGEVPQADLEKFLWDNVKDERTFTAVDLIEKIGLEKEAHYFRCRIK
jgi:hypothetical protein